MLRFVAVPSTNSHETDYSVESQKVITSLRVGKSKCCYEEVGAGRKLSRPLMRKSGVENSEGLYEGVWELESHKVTTTRKTCAGK
jgi:hypothetical protein